MKVEDKKQDWCTLFWEVYLGQDLSECCRIHDLNLSTGQFYRCLKGKVGYHAIYIAMGGALGALVKYPVQMWKRV